jgi:hypothetical protein
MKTATHLGELVGSDLVPLSREADGIREILNVSAEVPVDSRLRSR